MARLSWISWLILVCVGFLAFWTGATAFSLWMMAPALKKVIETMFEQAGAVIAAEFAIYVSLIVILQIAIVVDYLLTRGPIMALAWAAALYATWQQGGLSW